MPGVSSPHVVMQLLKLAMGTMTLLLAVAVPSRACDAELPVAARLAAEADAADITDSDPPAAAAREAELVTNVRQLTFEGARAGEGYFSRDGAQIVFQSEREPGNPFFQIYLMDRETGDVERVSPGYGKTTCAWIHPSGDKVLFASTQDDPDAKQKQQAEIELRQSGQQRRYSWDYDEHYEIYEYDRASGKYHNLTSARGYDAEGSWSPDGKLIAFTSNRRAYEGGLSEEEQKSFDLDPACLNDIYIMQADGSDVRRLTTVAGYDGGPFFSPDGARICWRRFAPNGATAEIWTMNIDGSDQRQLTHLNAMSWAPFYHPSGDYLIFTTNRHGFANFELYLIDTQGRREPVRVTYTKGFDGLPVFTPDGRRLAWTTNRTAAKQSQIFLADWNDAAARKLLGLGAAGQASAPVGVDTQSARTQAESVHRETTAEFTPDDARRHVEYLCRDELAGRLTGTAGEQLATAYVAAYLAALGLQPAGDNGTWYQPFEFTAGVELGTRNQLTAGDTRYEVDTDWRPLSFSGTGTFAAADVVFAGYGMSIPKTETEEAYNSFVHLDVKDKWVLVFRYLPENVSAEHRQQLTRPSDLRFKATVARDHGARGLIVVTGPNAQAKNQLVPLRLDGMLAGSSLPVLSVTDRVAAHWLAANGKTLKELQDRLDTGELMMGFAIKDLQLAADIDIRRIKKSGRNVLGRLAASDQPTEQVIVVGAHVDHLGRGEIGSSLARDDESDQIHYGADDNASGVAAMLEIAEYLADQQARGKLKLRRDIIFAAWSGEELGLLGSDHFVKSFVPSGKPLYPAVAACLNMDMVGRLDKNLILQGIGSSSIWRPEIERRNVPVGLPITLQNDSYLPTDAKSFFTHGVPALSAFTGVHSDYHTPRDVPAALNYDGAASAAKLMGLIARSLALRDSAPDYVEPVAAAPQPRSQRRVYLGTIPDYATEVSGVLLSGASKGGPADKAGVQAGDIVVELAGKKIENIYDYTHALEGLKIGQPAKLVVIRQGQRVTLEIVPGSRE